MINPRDKAFYNNLSRGTINSLFSDGNFGLGDIISNIGGFALGTLSIGARMLLRKRQGLLELGDVLRLVTHLFIIWSLFLAPFSIVALIFPDRYSNILNNTDIYGQIYFGLVVLASIYHYRIDYRYPKEGLEYRKEYRGRTIVRSGGINELVDMKYRLYDSFGFAIIGLAFITLPIASVIGYVVLVGGVALFIEELLYNNHVHSMKHNLIGSPHYIDLLNQLAEGEQKKNNSSESDDDVFEVEPIS